MNQILAEPTTKLERAPREAVSTGLHTIKGHGAVITGAAGGIGSALALEMARRGATGIALVDMGARVEQVATEINKETVAIARKRVAEVGGKLRRTG